MKVYSKKYSYCNITTRVIVYSNCFYFKIIVKKNYAQLDAEMFKTMLKSLKIGPKLKEEFESQKTPKRIIYVQIDIYLDIYLDILSI
jgi:hypothetical protein